MIRTGDLSQKPPFFLRGASTTALVALCVFANTTAFFRQAAPIQTPLASILTGIFFVFFGASVGVYAGSYLLKKSKYLSIGIPILISICITVLMYIGEAIMMLRNLYRFGIGWFFGELPGIVLAPVDILIILLSGATTWLILNIVRKCESWPGKRIIIAVFVLCLLIVAAGPIFAMTTPKSMDDDILGCYR